MNRERKGLARTAMLTRMVRFLACGLLLVGAYETTAVVLQAPAFTEKLRTKGISGQTRTQDISSMYLFSDYLFQTAVGFVNADAFSFATIERPDELATAEMVEERAQRAAMLLQRSVTLDPANAHKWFVYAQSLASAGRPKDALAAMDRSWMLSPTTLRLAYQRVWLYWAVSQALEVGALSERLRVKYLKMYMADRVIAENWNGSQEPLPSLQD